MQRKPPSWQVVGLLDCPRAVRSDVPPMFLRECSMAAGTRYLRRRRERGNSRRLTLFAK